MSYTLELNVGDELEINFELMNDLLMKRGYNTSDMLLVDARTYPYITFASPTETHPMTMYVKANSNYSYLYIDDDEVRRLRYAIWIWSVVFMKDFLILAQKLLV